METASLTGIECYRVLHPLASASSGTDKTCTATTPTSPIAATIANIASVVTDTICIHSMILF